MKSTEIQHDEVRQIVRARYGAVAEDEGCGCGPTCCGGGGTETPTTMSVGEMAERLGYSPNDSESVPEGSNLGLGCGNPVAIASLRPGQTVLDLGSGAGFDAFLAAKAVGPIGLVIGVDMTPQMLSKARKNKSKGNYANVDFRLGEIENLPVADATVDVIISNCVINLSPDKARVLREAFRVLKPGGRIAISDIVATAPMPESIRRDMELYAACVAGAPLIRDLENHLKQAGFTGIRVEPKPHSREMIREWFPGKRIEDYVVSATIEAQKPSAS